MGEFESGLSLQIVKKVFGVIGVLKDRSRGEPFGFEGVEEFPGEGWKFGNNSVCFLDDFHS